MLRNAADFPAPDLPQIKTKLSLLTCAFCDIGLVSPRDIYNQKSQRMLAI
jgi:hypothetical protein